MSKRVSLSTSGAVTKFSLDSVPKESGKWAEQAAILDEVIITMPTWAEKTEMHVSLPRGAGSENTKISRKRDRPQPQPQIQIPQD